MRPLHVALVACGLAATGWLVLRDYDRRHVQLQFVRADAPVPPIELTLFPARLAFAAPSPPPPLGTLQLDGKAASLGREQVPDAAVVRYRGAGIGTGYVHVRLGEALPPIPLRPPRRIEGRVGEPVAFWCYGWRCAGLRPVAGAEVTVMGGGEHGIDLGGAVTDADGRFVIDGVDSSLDGLGLRVRSRGHALAHEALQRFQADAREPEHPVIALAPATLRSGTVLAPAGVDPAQLLVLARGLPGVQTAPGPDGAFQLDHVPVGMQPRLVLAGLPETWTQLPARIAEGAAIRVEIVPGAAVRGRVLDAASQKPLAGALVWCGEADAVRADDDGNYELLRQLPGDVAVEAQWEFVDSKRHRTNWRGRKRVVLEPGRSHDHVDILVTAN